MRCMLLGMLEVMRCMPLGMLEAMRCVLLGMLEAMRCMPLGMLEAMRCVLLGMLDVMRCMRLGMLEAVEGGLCLREVSEVLDVLEVMRCMLLAGCCGRRAQFQAFRNFHCGSFLVTVPHPLPKLTRIGGAPASRSALAPKLAPLKLAGCPNY